jgi:dynein heavy chain
VLILTEEARQESIPLLQNLKNDALRDRHWKKLMEVTGRTFEMNPKTFTLNSLFAMQLHTVATAIDEITTYVCGWPGWRSHC